VSIIKGNFFFRHLAGQAGWSETYYFGPGTIDDAFTTFGAMAPLRAAILGNQSTLAELRVSDVAILGDSLVFSWDSNPLTTFSFPVDVPWNALLVRLGSSSYYRRNIFLRGVPDEVIVEPQNLAIDPTYAALVSTFLNFLKNSSNKILIRALSKVSPFMIQKGIGFQTNAFTPPTTDFTMDPASAPYALTTDRFRVSLIKDPYKEYNGTWDFQTVIGNKITLATGIAGPTNFIPMIFRVRQLHYDYFQIDSANVLKQVHRITGRPFDLQRGRRKVAK
jgi:hypothetical protein